MRHRFTWTAAVDICKSVNGMFDNAVVPESKYKLHKNFPIEEESLEYHLYCPKCKKYLGKVSQPRGAKTCSCGFTFDILEESAFFIIIDFEKQLNQLLLNEEFVKGLNYRFERENNSGDLRDIFDGKMYKKLSAPGKILSHKWNFSYTFNTDGCTPSRSSKTKVWPIYVTINELPKHLRRKYMILVGI